MFERLIFFSTHRKKDPPGPFLVLISICDTIWESANGGPWSAKQALRDEF